jgi:hypothetical protein
MGREVAFTRQAIFQQSIDSPDTQEETTLLPFALSMYIFAMSK